MAQYDVIIIGGGAAGIMAAFSVKKQHPGFTIAIIERSFALGRKILVSGAGRCNLTNVNLQTDPVKHYYTEEPELITSVFKQFGYREILDFFHSLGILTYEEQKNNSGKIFPITDQAKNVVAILLDHLEQSAVEVKLEQEVTRIQKTEQGYLIRIRDPQHKQIDLFANAVILAAGGQTYPALGANGSGFELARDLGHTIITPVPAAVSLTSKDKICHNLQGVKVPVSVASVINGEYIKSSAGDLIFTNYGVSGSAVLNLSREISINFNRGPKERTNLSVCFVLSKDPARFFTDFCKEQAETKIGIALYGFLPIKLADFICRDLSLNTDLNVNKLSENELKRLFTALTQWQITILGTRGWNEAEFTAGGINTAEVNAKTLESNLKNDLFLCGEVLDVDGDIGGFNLSWAWASGWVAGKLSSA